jgi:hypothetical protein
MSTEGKVLYSSELVMGTELIQEAFIRSGLKSRLETLKHFLLQYPDHAEARLALLGELRAVAEANTRSILGTSAGTSIAQSQQELGTVADGDIWSEYLREAASAFQMGLWKEDTDQFWGARPERGGGMRDGRPTPRLFRGGGNPLVSIFAKHSPTLKRLYQYWLPNIEYTLRMRPSSLHTWSFWLVVQRAAGVGRDLGSLRAGLVLGLDTKARDVPPTYIRSQWIQDCIDREEWRMAEDVARDAWDDLVAQASLAFGAAQGLGGRRGGASSLDERAWNAVVEPYIDVLLRQQKTGPADEVLRQWLAHEGWSDAPQRASMLANRLGLTDLGTRWARMK